jgi:hypothetical protein
VVSDFRSQYFLRWCEGVTGCLDVSVHLSIASCGCVVVVCRACSLILASSDVHNSPGPKSSRIGSDREASCWHRLTSGLQRQ